MKECPHPNCNLEVFENNDKSILYCKKDDWFYTNKNGEEIWDDKKTNEFWNELRKYITDKKKNNLNPYYFKNLVFPKTNILLIEEDIYHLLDKKNRLLDDFYFWKKGEKISFDQSQVYFSNVTFYEFELTYVKFKDNLTLDNVTALSALKLHGIELKELTINNCHDIKLLQLEYLSFDKCFINNSKIDTLSFYKTKLENLTIYSSDFNNVYFSNITINSGHLANSSINEVHNSIAVHIINKDTFSYQNMNVQKADREYFRLLKNYFFDKKDYIEANNMYQKEMNTYLLGLWKDVMRRRNLIKTLQDITVAAFGKYSSNFGQSWLRPFLWIIIFLFLKVYLSNDYTLSYLFSGAANLWDKISEQFYRLIDLKAFGLWDLLSKTLLGLLVYQLTVAIKRKTQY